MKASEKEKCRARYFVAKLAYSAGIAVLEQAENAPGIGEWLRTLLKYDSEATRHTALGGFSFPVDYNYELEEWPSLQGCTKEERAEVHGLQEQHRAKFRDFVLRVERCFPAYAGRVEELSICLERFEQDTGAWIFEKQWGDMEGVRRQKAEKRWKEIEADFRVLVAEVVNKSEVEIRKLASGGDCAHGKRVSKYLGRENITGDGDCLGWALSMPNGREIVFHKAGDSKRNAIVYTYNPAAVPIIDALIDAFQDSEKNGWINPRDLQPVTGNGKWQNKFTKSATLKKAIESESKGNTKTGNIRFAPGAFG